MSLSIKIDGMADFERRLTSLGNEMAAKVILSTAYTSAKVVENEIKANLIADGSIDTGTLYRSIYRKKIIYGDGVVVIVIGPRKGMIGYDKQGNRRIPSKYGHLVEKHTSFMSRAVQATGDEVRKKMAASLERKIKKQT